MSTSISSRDQLRHSQNNNSHHHHRNHLQVHNRSAPAASSSFLSLVSSTLFPSYPAVASTPTASVSPAHLQPASSHQPLPTATLGPRKYPRVEVPVETSGDSGVVLDVIAPTDDAEVFLDGASQDLLSSGTRGYSYGYLPHPSEESGLVFFPSSGGNGTFQFSNLTGFGRAAGTMFAGGDGGGGGLVGPGLAPTGAGMLEEEQFNWSILLLAPLVVFGIAGNTLVILAISLEKRLQNVTNYFLLSLAVTDLLVSLIVMPFSIINEFMGRWLFGLILCNLFITADVLMCTSSILHMCTISLERYVGIRYPLWTKNKSKRTVFFKIVLVWTLALAITSPITVLGLVEEHNILSGGHCLLSNPQFIIYGSVLAFFIPLAIMVLMYALTVRLLNRQAKLCAGGGGGPGDGDNGGEGQPMIRRSTSRRHWQRDDRQNVLGTTRNSYSFSHHFGHNVNSSHHSCNHHHHPALQSHGKLLHEPLQAVNSFPQRSFVPRYQALSKRNTLPRYHNDMVPKTCGNGGLGLDPTSSSLMDNVLSESVEYVDLCNGKGEGKNGQCTVSCEVSSCGDGGGSGGSDEHLDTSPNASKWRRMLQNKKNSSSSQDELGEPKRLKELVRKHHVAVKAANILLMRKDLIRKETSSVQTEQKASKVLGVVFMIFVICWAPFFLANILQVICTRCDVSRTLFSVFVWLGYVSSTLNPIIYTVFNKVFKQTFFKLLRCRYGLLHRGRRRSPPNHQQQQRQQQQQNNHTHQQQHDHHHRLPHGLLTRKPRAGKTSRRGSRLLSCGTFSCRSGSSSATVEESMC